jgi:hypothetical protein
MTKLCLYPILLMFLGCHAAVEQNPSSEVLLQKSAPISANARKSAPSRPRQPRNDTKKEFSITVLRETPYYIDGPQQSRPADGYFKAGTPLKLIKSTGSYVLVESSDGVQAYVSTRDTGLLEKKAQVSN